MQRFSLVSADPALRRSSYVPWVSRSVSGLWGATQAGAKSTNLFWAAHDAGLPYSGLGEESVRRNWTKLHEHVRSAAWQPRRRPTAYYVELH